MSSLRRRACQACAKSKRRCDSALPSCRRCRSQSVPCQYPFATAPSTASSSSATEDSLSLYISTSHGPISSTTLDSVQRGGPAGELPSESIPLSGMESLVSRDSGPSSLDGTLDQAILQEQGFVHDEAFPTMDWEFSALNASSASFDYNLANAGETPKSQSYVLDGNEGAASSLSEHLEILTPLTNPQFRRTKNWTLYAQTLVSNVTSFAMTATTFFISPQQSGSHSWPCLEAKQPLQKALGVCAAYTSPQSSNGRCFEQMLGAEVKALVQRPGPLDQQSIMELPGLISVFQESLYRLQAMVLYQIIGLFGASPSQRNEAERQEALVLSWTRELQLNIQAIQLHLHSGYIPTGQLGLGREELENAYRTILMSYIVRAVYAAVAYRVAYHCEVLKQLPVVIPSPAIEDDHSLRRQAAFNLGGKTLQNLQIHTMSYNDFAEEGMQKRWDSDTSDPFHVLLLAICRGSQA